MACKRSYAAMAPRDGPMQSAWQNGVNSKITHHQPNSNPVLPLQRNTPIALSWDGTAIALSCLNTGFFERHQKCINKAT